MNVKRDKKLIIVLDNLDAEFGVLNALAEYDFTWLGRRHPRSISPFSRGSRVLIVRTESKLLTFSSSHKITDSVPDTVFKLKNSESFRN